MFNDGAQTREEWRLDWESDRPNRGMSTRELVEPVQEPGRYHHSIVGHVGDLDEYRHAAEGRGGTGFTTHRRTVTTTYGPWTEENRSRSGDGR